MKALTFGYSPCPNDTFMFHAIATGAVSVPGYRFSIALHDVETLNDLAFSASLDITKLSFFAWLNVRDRYRLLQSGAAMGFGCGPVLIARADVRPSDIDLCRVVLPGRWTTAHLLFRLWAPQAKDRIFVPYNRIFETLRSGKADLGVIIHESRFTFASHGFLPIVDLGRWWEEKTGLPIPLGGIAAKKSLGDRLVEQLEGAVRHSIATAEASPERAMPYIRQHARELADDVLQAHIQTFVNEFSLDLPQNGRQAIAILETMARENGLL